MSEPQNDPSANTEAFQAFVRSAPAVEPPTRSRSTLVITVAVVVIVIVAAAVIWAVVS